MSKGKRKIIRANAVKWLPKNRDVGSIITSLPDLEETTFEETDYLDFFKLAAHECFVSATEGHPVIFYQTDRLYKGRRISKSNMLINAATAAGYHLVWHKIILRRDPGKIDLRRPGYSHLLCFGDDKVKSGRPTADVFYAGGVLYPNGMGLQAATVALQAAFKHGPRVCDPFCGRGTVPALAEAMGFTRIIGVDIDIDQVKAARLTRLYTGGKVKPQKKLPHHGKQFFITKD